MPLLSIRASGLRLRPEFAAVCGHSNISTSQLITLNDLPDRFRQPENVRWILVDHNKLQGKLGEEYSWHVYGVIDHHEEENAITRDTGSEPRVIEKCGSCTSLVVRYCKSAWDGISSSSLSSGAAHAQGEAALDDSAVNQGWDAQIAKMALASILVDTANLKAPGKVQQVDREAVEYLEAKIQMSAKDAKSWNCDQYFAEIEEAKRDIGHLSLDEIQQKDYKHWSENGMNLGMSSVVKPLEFLVKKAESGSSKSAFKEALQRFMNERGLSIYAIMTTSITTKGEFQRQLLLKTNKAASSVASRFAERAIPDLKLHDLEVEGIATQGTPTGDELHPSIWMQKDVTKSRKQVGPLLREAMRA